MQTSRSVLAWTTACALLVMVWASCAPKKDDWVYAPKLDDEAARSGNSPALYGHKSMMDFGARPAGASIGFSAGGAKDIGNFRENLKNGYLPLPTDVTCEGLFYDYTFDTGQAEACQKLFCPSYTWAVSTDPISKQREYFLSVGLNSGIKEMDFARKRLNLVVVLDISGSMSSAFDRYYYDRFGARREVADWASGGGSKMQVATRSIAALLDHLKPDDRLGIVLFDDRSYLAKPLDEVGRTDMAKIREHVLALKPQGGTDMSAGLKAGTELFAEVRDVDRSQVENRILFLTDAMPIQGETREGGLLGMARANARAGINTTFIGIGVDFNSQLIEAITKIRGANYYSVHSAEQFSKRLDEEFEFMVTPLVFDLTLKLEAEGYEIVAVYGSPEANQATGTLMKVNTLFPSKVENGETRGGVVLLELRRMAEGGELSLITSYEDRTGARDGDRARVTFPDPESDSYQNKGIRKAVLLARYANLLIHWLTDERRAAPAGGVEPTFSLTRATGIVPPDVAGSRWERGSRRLSVSVHYQELFDLYAAHMRAEQQAIGDAGLAREIAVLEQLAKMPSGQ